MEIGTAIKALRKEKGMGQKELADKCDISVNALSQIETNASFPQKETIRKICAAFGIPTAYLLLFSMNDVDVSDDRKGTFNYLSDAIKAVLIDDIKG
jgi:XRE family transcriptional regulator, regulator of sulfur utilization